MLPLLVGVREEHLGESVEADIVLGEVGAHQEVLKGGAELLTNLL